MRACAGYIISIQPFLSGVIKLRNLITKVAGDVTIDGKPNSQKVMGEKVPSSYLTLATLVDEKRAELEKAGSIPLLRRCQFQELINESAIRHPNDYLDPDDVDVATEFLHNIGKLDAFLYYSMEYCF